MMTPAMTVVSRLMALSLLAALIGSFGLLVVQPLWLEYRNNGEAIRESSQLLARYQALAGDRSSLESQLNGLRERQAQEGYVLTGSTDALAAAELQDRVKSVIAESGGSVRSIQILPSADDGKFRRIAIRLQMTTTTAAFFDVAYALETTMPLLFLDNVDVQSRVARVAAGKPAPEPVLSVTLDLYGYRQPDGT
jgi:general secretion pathway protein M